MIVSFLGYLLLMLAVGWAASRQSASQEDYFLGGRSIGAFAAAMSACASDMSGWLLMGIPGFIYSHGISIIWVMISLLIGSTCCWLILAKPLRTLSEQYQNSITIPEYLSNRAGCQGASLRRLCAVVIVVFFTIYASSGIVAAAKLIHNSFGVGYLAALAISGTAICSYTFLGGFLAVVWTDIVQACLMLVSLIVVPSRLLYLAWNGNHGLSITEVVAQNPHLLDFFATESGKQLSWTGLLSLSCWGLGYFGQPHIVTRYFALSGINQIKKSAFISFSWNLLSLCFAFSIGILGFWYCKATNTPLTDSETIFIFLAEALFDPVIAGVLLSAILAAVMSTADSQLLIASTCISHDIFKVAPEHRAKLGKLSLAVMTFAACALGHNPNSSVLSLVAYAWAGFGACFGPTLLASCYLKDVGERSIWGGILSGATTLAVIHALRYSGIQIEIYELLPGFCMSTLGLSLGRYLDLKQSSLHQPHQR